MSLYRFSPIKSLSELREAIRYTHFACSELCKKKFGRYLPVAGNIGIFCHYDDEYALLTKLREELTGQENWNRKYYRLHQPITIPVSDTVPETTYTYLYIRKPDQHKEVGDVDFVLGKKEYATLKRSLVGAAKIDGMSIFERPGLDLIRLSDPDMDVLSFIGDKNMDENMMTEEARVKVNM